MASKSLFLLQTGEFLLGTVISYGEETVNMENPLIVYVKTESDGKRSYAYRAMYPFDILEKGEKNRISINSSHLMGKIEGKINPAILANYDKIFNIT